MCDMFGEDEKLNADTEKNFEKDCHICDAIGHEIKAVNHLMHRKMLESAAKNGVDKVTIMHGWITIIRTTIFSRKILKASFQFHAHP